MLGSLIWFLINLISNSDIFDKLTFCTSSYFIEIFMIKIWTVLYKESGENSHRNYLVSHTNPFISQQWCSWLTFSWEYIASRMSKLSVVLVAWADYFTKSLENNKTEKNNINRHSIWCISPCNLPRSPDTTLPSRNRKSL